MVELQETSRTYIFPNKEQHEVYNVVDLQVSKSGGHRLTCANGAMVYIPFKWIAIQIISNHGWEA